MENWLRTRGGEAVYTVSFVDQYITPILYPSSLSRETQWMLGGIVVGVNVCVYLLVLRRLRGSG
jgi:hypothetical protein